ncbi:MerR family transcriptional regulator [Ramlibacter tataouinensis]|uniref:MerR family transcriptional regulator n=1 Tax=Ramlibacter tataouinensis TaxID=94132 RepID=UPI0022F381F8|nr:MerR family transcriptional regulator [Ramlibacter tataouinensis]WBY01503.1 MerR family transcriptional regulator [Ramlibacter tataouinensis]
MATNCFSISAVERELGLSKDVLRVWERRYGFPVPERDGHDERIYPAAQVERLRLVKRLMDRGWRPGRLLPLSADELQALADVPRPTAGRREGGPATSLAAGGGGGAGAGDDGLDGLLDRVRSDQPDALLHTLQRRLVEQGLRSFVQDTVAPLTVSVGLAWEHGRLGIHEEHWFTEVVARILRQAITALPADGGPRVLLTTLPGEPHGLGLLMAEAVFALAGARCIPLGTQTPVLEIVQAAGARQADAVALSFSAAFPARQVTPLLRQVRGALPAPTQLWAGGAGVGRIAASDGVRLLATLDDAAAAVAQWRAAEEPGTVARPPRSAA